MSLGRQHNITPWSSGTAVGQSVATCTPQKICIVDAPRPDTSLDPHLPTKVLLIVEAVRDWLYYLCRIKGNSIVGAVCYRCGEGFGREMPRGVIIT